ncbi:MAG: dTDP-4-dehydrorhamnose 3,5-epimerase [Rhodospirillales bacterium]|nr:dTDP-4-dehydrorhamnose 3,5-epimerase [Rhodospirillales bacterium]
MDVPIVLLQNTKLFVPVIHRDSRGSFCEVYSKRTLREFGIDVDFVQDNQSSSLEAGTVRGLHYQSPPFAQAKLVRVVRGRIHDVVVDVRRGSPTYGQWHKVELSADGGEQLFVPEGFLHGFITLEPDTYVIYKVSNYYSREHDGAVLWNDPDLAIDWGIAATSVHLSEKDASAQSFGAFCSPFVYAR